MDNLEAKKIAAARLVASRDPIARGRHAASMCKGIECEECFNCHALEMPAGFGEMRASVWVRDAAVAWLKARGLEVAEPK